MVLQNTYTHYIRQKKVGNMLLSAFFCCNFVKPAFSEANFLIYFFYKTYYYDVF